MWRIANTELQSRLFIGTALYPSPEIMLDAIKASQAQVITVSIRRQNPTQQSGEQFWQMIQSLGCHLLPNTAGCKKANEAVTTAEMAREIFQTHWIKLEVIGDEYNLQPDPFELVKAAQILIGKGFEVFPYCTDDLVLCQRLVDVGCKILMPWGAPIGSGQGLINPFALRTLRERFEHVPMLIDAGIGSPQHAVLAMELGYDGILLNSAVALADDSVKMARAFQMAIEAGRLAYEAGKMAQRDMASPSTPLVDTPFWQQVATSDENDG